MLLSGLRVASMFLAALLLATGPAHASPERWAQEGWKTDFSQVTIDLSEVMSGGPPRDGIPSIDDPKFVAAAEAAPADGQEPVIALTVNGETKAYPLSILMWHEIANDTIGGMPVAVTYCPLCNASIVFERVLNGEAVEFGTTGKLRKSDLIMYDRKTDSWWQQFTGEAIAGTMAGRKLKMVPSRIMAFAGFKTEFPEAEVLVPNNPTFRNYGKNPYVGYDSAQVPFLYRGDMPEGVAPMERVVVIKTEGEPIIVTMNTVREKAFEKDGYTAEWQDGVRSALDSAVIADSKSVGTVRVMKDGKDVVHDQTFAFVAHAFHPEVAIIGANAN